VEQKRTNGFGGNLIALELAKAVVKRKRDLMSLAFPRRAWRGHMSQKRHPKEIQLDSPVEMTNC
jgi:hypothetical protein